MAPGRSRRASSPRAGIRSPRAAREFVEETGLDVTPRGACFALDPVDTGSERVHAWAVEGDLDVAAMRSNTFTISGRRAPARAGSSPRSIAPRGFGLEEARRESPGPATADRRARATRGEVTRAQGLVPRRLPRPRPPGSGSPSSGSAGRGPSSAASVGAMSTEAHRAADRRRRNARTHERDRHAHVRGVRGRVLGAVAATRPDHAGARGRADPASRSRPAASSGGHSRASRSVAGAIASKRGVNTRAIPVSARAAVAIASARLSASIPRAASATAVGPHQSLLEADAEVGRITPREQLGARAAMTTAPRWTTTRLARRGPGHLGIRLDAVDPT